MPVIDSIKAIAKNSAARKLANLDDNLAKLVSEGTAAPDDIKEAKEVVEQYEQWLTTATPDDIKSMTILRDTFSNYLLNGKLPSIINGWHLSSEDAEILTESAKDMWGVLAEGKDRWTWNKHSKIAANILSIKHGPEIVEVVFRSDRFRTHMENVLVKKKARYNTQVAEQNTGVFDEKVRKGRDRYERGLTTDWYFNAARWATKGTPFTGWVFLPNMKLRMPLVPSFNWGALSGKEFNAIYGTDRLVVA